ncbi:hypothetical protein GCM10028778_11030 [Barrientosiimonas marina]
MRRITKKNTDAVALHQYPESMGPEILLKFKGNTFAAMLVIRYAVNANLLISFQRYS